MTPTPSPTHPEPFLTPVLNFPHQKGLERGPLSEPPQKGPENWCRAEIVEKCRKKIWHVLAIFDCFLPCAKNVESVGHKYFWHFLRIFDVFFALREKCQKVSETNIFGTFWRFLTFFALREKCQKVSETNIFGTFWRFLTFFDVAPFRRPLLRSADFKRGHYEKKVSSHWISKISKFSRISRKVVGFSLVFHCLGVL